MIQLITVDGESIDLSVSEKFVKHYEDKTSFAKYILDNEINNGQWFDETLLALPDNAVIVDLGMNVGMFTLYLNKPKATVFGVEPTESHIEVAIDLFTKLERQVEVFQGVVYSQDGKVKLFTEGDNSTMNRVSDHGWTVEAKTLRSLFESYNIESVDLLKIDIEGAEGKVLLEDPTVNEPLSKCKLVFVETHDGMDGQVVNVQGIIEKMKSLGFTHKPGRREWSHYFIKG